MITRARKLKRDPAGLYRPYVGHKICDDQKRRQHRFNLGRDERVAAARYAQIQALYEDVTQATGSQQWTADALAIAENIAKGKTQHQTQPLPPHISSYAGRDHIEYRQWVDHQIKSYPSVQMTPDDPARYSIDAPQAARQLIQDEITALRERLDQLGILLMAGETMPETLIKGKLHEAIDAMKAQIDRDGEKLDSGKLKAWPILRKEYLDQLRQHHEDIDLQNLNYDQCLKMITYWRNRPVGARGNRIKASSAKNQIKELINLFKWLDTSSEYQWSMPKGVLDIPRTVARLPEDRKTTIINKHTYTVSELAILAKHATEREKVSLYCGLNFAAGAAELGRILVSDILFDHQHEYAKLLQFESTSSDTFARYYRPKSDVFGEWLVWPEVAVELRKAVARAKKLKSDVIWCRDTGKPLYSEDSKNSQSSFSNLWSALVKRTRKTHPDFRYLPFGSLRDTLPDMIRQRYTDELASLCLAHGSPSNDSLLHCYSNRPYGRLHDALREIYKEVKPIFAAV